MSRIQQIYDEYSRLRGSGADAKGALNALRAQIEQLNKAEREELAKQLRSWEARPVTPDPAIPQPARIKPIKPLQLQAIPLDTPSPDDMTQPQRPPSLEAMEAVQTPAAPERESQEAVEWVACQHCGKANQRHEVFCYACGQLLEPSKGTYDTRHFGEVVQPDEGYFGADSVLALRPRGSVETYEARPQHADHELVVGRSVEGSVITPDIDLNSKQAADLGVSRMHLSIRYDKEHNTVLVSDLGSSNGTFINGQRLTTKEVRALRHGDELRLGRMVMMVSFRHPGVPAAH